ncbi:MAG: DsrE/DsrF/DrsH-like family protein [Thermodesulfobacteriota bacterium]
MTEKLSGLAIIFHSESFDRIQHGLHIAQAALALGREVRLFFTYGSLYYLKKNSFPLLSLEKETSIYAKNLKEKRDQNLQEELNELLRQTNELGAKFYVCSNSMSLLNIARNELSEVVDRSMGLIAFLTATAADQILFI